MISKLYSENITIIFKNLSKISDRNLEINNYNYLFTLLGSLRPFYPYFPLITLFIRFYSVWSQLLLVRTYFTRTSRIFSLSKANASKSTRGHQYS